MTTAYNKFNWDKTDWLSVEIFFHVHSHWFKPYLTESTIKKITKGLYVK